MIRDAYLAVRHLLTPIDALQLVDYDLGQYGADGEVLASPAVYIGFLPVRTTGFGASTHLQTAQLTIAVTLATEVAYADERAILDRQLVDHLGLEAEIFARLQNKGVMLSAYTSPAPPADGCVVSDIARSGYNPPAVRRGLLISQQQFTATVYDVTAVPELRTHLATLEVELRYVKRL